VKLPDEAALMEAIARRKLTDVQVLEAVMPGSSEGMDLDHPPLQVAADRHQGADPRRRVHPLRRLPPGSRRPHRRRAPARRADRSPPRSTCPDLSDGDDEDWVDLTWGDKAEGGTARINVTLKNEPGALGAVATLIGQQKANILGLRLDNRDTTFHTNTIDLEVRNADASDEADRSVESGGRG
jgi:guanosine-3',5'-bis(diphosphate) 3'-pyrophosphohydrolase